MWGQAMPTPPNCARLASSLQRTPASAQQASPRLPRVHTRAPLHSEWAINQHRDSHALYVGFDSLASFFSIAENEAIGRVKFSSLQARGAVPFCAQAVLTADTPHAYRPWRRK
jgi:hypothetical protein